jgi:hypothetical protein
MNIVSGGQYLAKMKWADGGEELCRVKVHSTDEGTFCADVYCKRGRLVYGDRPKDRFTLVQRAPIDWIVGAWPGRRAKPTKRTKRAKPPKVAKRAKR